MLADTYLLDIFTSFSNRILTFKFFYLYSSKAKITYTWAPLQFLALRPLFFEIKKSFRLYIMLEQRLILPLHFESTQFWPVQFVFVPADSIRVIPTEQEDVVWNALKQL